MGLLTGRSLSRWTGKTNDLERREGEHARGEQTKDLRFEVDKRTDIQAGVSRGATAEAPAGSARITQSQQVGCKREARTQSELEAENPNASVQREQYLRDSNGRIVRDPQTGEARRVDHAVIENGSARTYEMTGPNVNKSSQLAKEGRIRDSGGPMFEIGQFDSLCQLKMFLK